MDLVGLMAMALAVLSPSVLGLEDEQQQPHLRRLEAQPNAPGGAEAAGGQAQGGDQEHWGYGGYGGYGYPYYPYYNYYPHYPYYPHRYY